MGPFFFKGVLCLKPELDNFFASLYESNKTQKSCFCCYAGTDRIVTDGLSGRFCVEQPSSQIVSYTTRKEHAYVITIKKTYLLCVSDVLNITSYLTD